MCTYVKKIKANETSAYRERFFVGASYTKDPLLLQQVGTGQPAKLGGFGGVLLSGDCTENGAMA